MAGDPSSLLDGFRLEPHRADAVALAVDVRAIWNRVNNRADRCHRPLSESVAGHHLAGEAWPRVWRGKRPDPATTTTTTGLSPLIRCSHPRGSFTPEPAGWPTEAPRPQRSFERRTLPVSKAPLSCLTARFRPERQLSNPANAYSRPQAEIGWLGKRTFRNARAQGRGVASLSRRLKCPPGARCYTASLEVDR